MSYGVLELAPYVPPMRLERSEIYAAVGWAVPSLKGLATGERAIANWDEDAITMGFEAARSCLSAVQKPPSRVTFASTTFPFADRSNSGIICSALDMPSSVRNEDVFGSRRAAVSALVRYFETKEDGLLVASDCRDAKPGSAQEMNYGHGAAAVLLGKGRVKAEIIAVSSIHDDLVDQYRSRKNRFDYALEERWVREEGWLKTVPKVIENVMNDAAISAENLDKIIVHGSSGASRSIAKKLGISQEKVANNLYSSVGDVGVAHPLLMLAEAIKHSNTGDFILMVGFGQGADVVLLKRTKEKLTNDWDFESNRRVVKNYTQYLSLRDMIAIDFGLRAERDNRTALSAFYRKNKEITGMLGGRCTKCNTLQFPKSLICVKCGASHSQEFESLANMTGRVKSFTEDWLAYTPFPPYIYGNVEFEGEANIMLEFADFGPGQVKVGDQVRLVFRIKDFDDKRDFRRYFWKPAPS